MSTQKSTKFRNGDLVRLKDDVTKDADGDELRLESSLAQTRHGFVVGTLIGRVQVQGPDDKITNWDTFNAEQIELVSRRPEIPRQPIPVGALVRVKDTGQIGILRQIDFSYPEASHLIAIVYDTAEWWFARDDLDVLDDATIPALLKKAGELA